MSACPKCGEENAERARFCQNCGSPLPITEPVQYERKLVSVLFVDLVGFTARSDRADPEDVRDLQRTYHDMVRNCIEEFGGKLEKFIGDAVMAVFGVPLSYGDDAERAVRAGLQILSAIEQLNRSQPGLDLNVHGAVNTGEAVVRTGTRSDSGEPLATGDVVNTASRLQVAAPAGSIIVGEETRRATRGAIKYSEIAPIEARGKRDLLRAWRAEGAITAPGERAATLAPMIGRKTELDLLQRLWSTVVNERKPQLVTVVGEPGIGKSRLVREVARRNTGGGGRLFRGRCQPYAERTVYTAFAQQIRQVARIFDNDPPNIAREKLERLVSTQLVSREASELGRYLPLLLGLGPSVAAQTATHGGSLTAAPHEERVENRLPLFFAARRLVESLGQEQPTVLVFEDIHWADTSELDLIEYLAWHLKDTAVMLIAPTRAELLDWRSDWGAGLGTHTKIVLDPLSRDESLKLATSLLKDADQVARVAEAAGGNPLFIEELAAAVSETGKPRELPTSVNEAIAANIDSLPPNLRTVLLEASVVGKTFWRDVLAAVTTGRSAAAALDSLVARRLVRHEQHSQLSGDEQFVFKHALVHEVAYATLPRAARRALHAKVASELEARLGGATAEMANILAHHWREAGEPDRALGYLLTAAERALKAWAKDEATRLYDEALALVPEIDVRQRARIRLMHGRALVELGDFAQGSAELDAVIGELDGRDQVEALLARARAAFWLEETEQVAMLAESAAELAEGLEARDLLGPALSFVAVANSTRGAEGDLDRAIAIGNRALEVWVPGSRPIDLAIHKEFHAMAHYWSGHYQAAADLAQSSHELGGDYDSIEALFRGGGEQALAMVAMGRHAEGIVLAQTLLNRAQDIGRRWGSFVRSVWSMALRDLNQFNEARQLNEEARELALSVGAEFGATEQMIDLLVIDLMRGEIGRAQSQWNPLRHRVDGRKTWFRWLAEVRMAAAEARLALETEQLDSAVDLAYASMALASRAGRPKYEVQARLTLSEALLQLGKPQDAITELRPAVAIADNLGSPPLRWQTRAILGRAAYATGNDESSSVAFGEASELLNDFAATLKPEQSASLLASPVGQELLRVRK